ncbi:MAG: helix-turn-helix domain-containing protein [Sulfurihydrogenibium sp.]|jgi:ParB-like chromosome segregation protein Spo0J|nr:helix-turn-helix domain-containing protein [Sulfurihydrogenibium sp.]
MKVLGVQEIPIDKIEIMQGILPRTETTYEEKIEEYKESMSVGATFPPITVWRRNDSFWLIDGFHRLMASKQLGKTKILAEIVELKDTVEAEIMAIEKNKHGIPLSKSEKKLLCQKLYLKNVPIAQLQKIFGVSERTIYNWTSGLKRKEKPEELKERALEMRRQGYTQEEVARELGVDQGTISRWEKDELCEPAKIADLHKTPTPSEEEPDFYDDIEEEEDEISYEKLMKIANNPEISKQASEYTQQKFLEEERKKSYGGRPPNDPPPLTEKEEYERLKNELIYYMEKMVVKIGWDKALSMFEEALEEIKELSKSAKRG